MKLFLGEREIDIVFIIIVIIRLQTQIILLFKTLAK